MNSQEFHNEISLDIVDGPSDRGASMVEYALLVVLIALIAFVAVEYAGHELSNTYSSIADSVAKAGG